jgi:double-stranded uracil-DNA glycosylase
MPQSSSALALAPILPDVLAPDLDVVFCGSAAGRRSAQIGAYYAGAGNKFWPTLHAIGLTPRQIAPQDYRQILRYRLGLTDLAKFASGADAGLRRGDFCAATLRGTIARYRPRIVAFTSKRTAREFFGRAVDYGVGSARVEGALTFTLSSPSGLACGHWQQGRYWHELGELVRSHTAREAVRVP